MTAWRLSRPELPLVVGGALTVLTAYAALALPTAPVVPAVFGLTFFVGATLCFLLAPHVAVAITIPLFAFLPAIKLLAAPSIGPIKDAVTIAAGAALLIAAVRAREEGSAWLDRKLGIAIASLLALYVVNIGGILNDRILEPGWMHGVRLVAEPLILLLAGLGLANARTLRWAAASIAGTAAVVALYGIYQQLVGHEALIAMGYSYEEQVRTIGGRLRSFGTLDEPFAYAGFLLLGLASIMFPLRHRATVAALLVVVGVGLALSQVRSAAVVCAALVGLWLARRRLAVVAAFVFIGATIVAVGILVAGNGATETETVQTSQTTYLTINGRTEAWRVVFEKPGTIPLGKGVGVIGTAAQRAEIDAGVGRASRENTRAVDSGYFATLADVGVAGLVLVVFILLRLMQLGVVRARAGERAGWFAVALVITLVIDSITRSSFTAFPTAFLGFLLIGLALGAPPEREPVGAARPAA